MQGPEKERDVPVGAKGSASADCLKEIADRTMELMDRITVYFGVCALDEKHASFSKEDDTFTISEEGQALLCDEACKDHADLAAEAPDSSALLEACSDKAKELKIIRVHDAFDAARKTCPSEEAPLIDVEDDLSSNVEDSLGSNVWRDVPDVADEQIKVEPEIIKVEPEIIKVQPAVVQPEVVDVLPGNSPKAPFKGNRIRQQTFEYDLKNALADRNDGNCDKLKAVFKKCDYKGTGKVYIAQIDNMLDKLESQKVETMDLLHKIAEKVKKDPVQEPLTFKDWTRFKLDSLEATKCALEYATRK
jgi:hypothetical protein